MKKPVVAALVLLAAVVLFPPADHVRDATPPSVFGDTTIGGLAEFRLNQGFIFLPEIGGSTRIRFPQWLVEIGVAVVVVGVAGTMFGTKKS